MMEKKFIPHEIALHLKQKGFNEPCLAKWMLDMKGDTIPHFRYNNRIALAESVDEGVWFNHNGKDVSNLNGNDGKDFLWSAPTYEQTKDWFMDKHNIHIMYMICGSRTKVLGYKWFVQVGMNEDGCYQTKMIKDYYVGMTEAIKEALKLI